MNLELLLWQAIAVAEAKTSAYFHSREEQISGHFISNLEQELGRIAGEFQAIASKEIGGSWFLAINYQDLSTHRREKITGCDIGLLLQIDVEDLMKRCAFSVLQAKKILPNAVMFVDADFSDQLNRMTELSSSAFVIFYDQSRLFSPVSVVPAAVVRGIRQSRQSTAIRRDDLAKTTTRFASFLVYDFIAGWVGDERYPCNLGAMREYLSEKCPVQRILTVSIKGRKEQEG